MQQGVSRQLCLQASGAKVRRSADPLHSATISNWSKRVVISCPRFTDHAGIFVLKLVHILKRPPEAELSTIVCDKQRV